MNWAMYLAMYWAMNWLTVGARVGDSNIKPAPIASDKICVWFDSRLSRPSHVTNIRSFSFDVYDIYHIRKYLSQQSTEAFISAKILPSNIAYFLITLATDKKQMGV